MLADVLTSRYLKIRSGIKKENSTSIIRHQPPTVIISEERVDCKRRFYEKITTGTSKNGPIRTAVAFGYHRASF
ncbi:hypothetical protein JCM19039_1816 [Geomicrobium sp. JCM 19039]|nr:hypothetical protein JCM19039_1816 [Geomicrobium sp. JCM 19039]